MRDRWTGPANRALDSGCQVRQKTHQESDGSGDHDAHPDEARSSRPWQRALLPTMATHRDKKYEESSEFQYRRNWQYFPPMPLVKIDEPPEEYTRRPEGPTHPDTADRKWCDFAHFGQ